jgi:predicted aspartyl protease
MLIAGRWLVSGGMVRPILEARLVASDGSLIPTPFLVDTGADRTVLGARSFAALHLPALPATEQLAGVGGIVSSVLVQTRILLTCEDGTVISIKGPFAVFTDPEALDMCVLGRDVTNHFAVIVDRLRDGVFLLNQTHSYQISFQA